MVHYPEFAIIMDGLKIINADHAKTLMYNFRSKQRQHQLSFFALQVNYISIHLFYNE